ncbi:MAG: hypothetical protein ACLQGP_26935 [Isosphaeraceae bacterium]
MSDPIWLSVLDEQRELETQVLRRLRALRAHRPKTRKVAGWVRQNESVEIRSGAIIPESDRPGLYCLEVNTAQGLRRFEHAQEISETDAPLEMQGQIWEHVQSLHTAIVGMTFISWSAEDDERREDSPSPASTRAFPQSAQKSVFVTSQNNDELSPEELLHRLKGDSLGSLERRRLIIEAEALVFAPGQLGPLQSVLRDFIAKYRESNDPDDLVAVSAAIRKFVATLKADEALTYAAELFEAGSRSQVSLEVELELVKMAVRKLTANPPKQNDFLPDLGDQLLEVAKTYLNPRLLAREKYAAIALNAILAIALLRSRHVAEVVRLVSGINVRWFRQLLARRAGRLQLELKERCSSESLDESVDALKELVAQLV